MIKTITLILQLIATGTITPIRFQSVENKKDLTYLKVQALVTRNLRSSRQLRGKEAEIKLITDTIVVEARRHKIDPLLVAVTAEKESNFNMNAKQQAGIMQFTKRTWRSIYASRGMQLYDTHDNIAGGVDYLARHLYGTTKHNKHGTYWPLHLEKKTTPNFPVTALRRMWGNYNGCGPNGGYVSTCLRWYRNMHDRSPEQILKQGVR